MIEPLTTMQLDDILYNTSVTSKSYIGTYPSCFSPASNKPFYAFISNTEKHDEDGEHWCAWVVKEDTICYIILETLWKILNLLDIQTIDFKVGLAKHVATFAFILSMC